MDFRFTSTWLMGSAIAAALLCVRPVRAQEPDEDEPKVPEKKTEEPKAKPDAPPAPPKIADPKAAEAKSAEDPAPKAPKSKFPSKSPAGGKSAGFGVPPAGGAAPAAGPVGAPVGGAPAGKAAVAAPPAAAGPKAEVQGDGKVRFYWKDADVEMVIKFLEHALSVPVYRQVVLPAARITIVNDKPITVDEALDTFHAVLQTMNVAVIDRRPQFVLLVGLEKAKTEKLDVRFNPRPGEKNQLRPRPNIIRAVFPVRGDDGQNLAAAMRSMISAWGDLTFNKSDNSLTAVDTEERLMVFQEYLERIMPSPAGVDDLRVFALNSIEADEAAFLVARVLVPMHAPASAPREKSKYALPEVLPDPKSAGLLIVPNGRARQLLVRGTAEQLKKVEGLLAVIDTPTLPPPPLEETVRVFPLQYADPDAVAENLRELFRAEPGASSGGAVDFDRGRRRPSEEGGGRPFGPPPPSSEGSSSAPAGSSSSAAPRLSRSTVRITPNRDQHCIVVAGSKADLERAEKVIKEIEAIRPVNPREVVTRIYEIRHSTATEIATILNKVFEGRADSSEADRSSSSSQPGGYSSYYSPYGYGGFGGGYSPYGYGGYGSGFGGDADRGGDRGRGFSPGGFGSSNPYIDRSWYSSSSSSSSSRSSRDRRSGSSGSSSPSGPTVGLRAAVPDTRTNRVIVTAPQGEFVNIEKVIEEIDRPSRSGGIIEILPVPQGRDIQKILRRAEEIYKATRPIAEGN